MIPSLKKYFLRFQNIKKEFHRGHIFSSVSSFTLFRHFNFSFPVYCCAAHLLFLFHVFHLLLIIEYKYPWLCNNYSEPFVFSKNSMKNSMTQYIKAQEMTVRINFTDTKRDLHKTKTSNWEAVNPFSLHTNATRFKMSFHRPHDKKKRMFWGREWRHACPQRPLSF